MTTQTFTKTIVAYLGGSAGDLFVYSMNGCLLDSLAGIRVDNTATLKTYEMRLKKGESVNLLDELSNLEYQYISTHLYTELMNSKDVNLLSIIIDDPDTQLKCIYRQMQIQKLRIVANDTHDWFNIVRDHCLSNRYDEAAIYWFENAKQLWLDAMTTRLQESAYTKINFNRLFDVDFVHSIHCQGWNNNLTTLKANHDFWLTKNHTFNYNITIASMSQKLKTMDWTKTSGWVEYNA
jgi:hypothetical protein